MKMDYVGYDSQITPTTTTTWNPTDQTGSSIPRPPVTPIAVASTSTGVITEPAPIMQQQPPPQNIKSELHHSQTIVYGVAHPTHQTMNTYDMSAGWTPQIVPQNVIQVPQWPTTSDHHHPVSIDPNGVGPISISTNSCIHPATHSQQSQYTQYHSSMPTSGPSPVTTYWNQDLVNNQPQQQQQPNTLTTLNSQHPPPNATNILSTMPPDNVAVSDPNLIDSTFTLTQPSVSSAMQQPAVGIQAAAPQQQLPVTVQFDDQIAMGSSSQVNQISAGLTEGPGSLEDALEVIKSHAEHFSGQRQTCSSSSDDDDDDDEHSRGPRSGEREKERRQANNARER